MADVTALATVQPHALQAQSFFTSEQERMILSQFLGGATKDEATVLLEIVKRRRLDPFSRQVYFVKRWDAAKREEVWAIQTSIDGLRSIAERTGKYDGQDEPVYGEDDAGKFCKVKVYRKDWSASRAAVGVAYEREFIQKKKDGTVTSFWARMPRLMLAKCAEALAIRKAFPEDTGGLYISEEMGETTAQAEAAPVHPAPPPPPQLAAAKVVEAEVVKEPAKPEPPPKRATPAPPYVAALWKRATEALGSEAKMKWEVAASSAFGLHPKPSHSWTAAECASVEAALFPKDVDF
jgi:phage recombination protein Bet